MVGDGLEGGDDRVELLDLPLRLGRNFDRLRLHRHVRLIRVRPALEFLDNCAFHPDELVRSFVVGCLEENLKFSPLALIRMELTVLGEDSEGLFVNRLDVKAMIFRDLLIWVDKHCGLRQR